MPFTVRPEAAPEEEAENPEIENTGLLQSKESSAPAALTKWFKVNKDLGPIHIGRIGVQYEYTAQKFWILLDAGLELAVLEVSVDGLRVGSSLSEFKPELQLSGLGIDFHKGPLEIGGALIFQKPSDENAETLTFIGMVTLRFKELGLAIYGSYTDELGEPSVLFYGNLDYPIGGPPFFFVEGLAAGGGINRKVHYPAIDNLGEFSLIKAVMHPDPTVTLTDRIKKMNEDFRLEKGSYFFAAGIKFSTFKLINSFVLLILGVGEEIELDLLGYSVLSAPMPKDGKKVDPVAQARLMVHAAFRPDSGTLQVEARLDPENSFLVSRKCKLQGGFAFYAWFEADNLSSEGGQYEGDFSLSIKAAYRDKIFQVELELSTEVAIWGPEFGGTAHLKILFIEVDVAFGEPRVSKPSKLDWSAFATAFLSPVSNENDPVPGVFSARITQGLLPGESAQDDFLGVVDPSTMELAVESMVPFTTGKINDREPVQSEDVTIKTEFGIAPMDRQGVTSELRLTIKYKGDQIDDFIGVPILKNGPATMWGPKMKAGLNDKTTVDNCLFGYRIILKPERLHPDCGAVEWNVPDLETESFGKDVRKFPYHPEQFKWLTQELDELAENYFSAATSTFLKAFGIEENLEGGNGKSQPVELLKIYEPQTH